MSILKILRRKKCTTAIGICAITKRMTKPNWQFTLDSMFTIPIWRISVNATCNRRIICHRVFWTLVVEIWYRTRRSATNANGRIARKHFWKLMILWTMSVNMVRTRRNLNDRIGIMRWRVVGWIVGKHLQSSLFSLITDAPIRKRSNVDARIVEHYSAIFPNFTIISGDNPLRVSNNQEEIFFSGHLQFPLRFFLDDFQCSQCLKYFFSMELLRNHQHVHVNRYKCTMCDMTTSSPSGLVQHVRYRHVKAKPFACSQCDYG